MNKVTETFQNGEWDTPGWGHAKEVVVALNSVADPATLDFDTKIHLLQKAMRAATQSPEWIDFLIAVADELTQANNAQQAEA